MKKMPLFLVCVLIFALMPGFAFAESTAVENTAATIDLTDAIAAVFALLSALITKRLLPWLKSKAGAEQLQLLEAAIDTAVYAAQQLYKTTAIDDRLGFALSWLRERGYDVDRAEVEARVWKMDHVDNSVIELAEGAAVPIDADGMN